jgi:FkbM family methyltransferase
MRLPSPSYRTLFFVTAVLVVVTSVASLVTVRRLEAARRNSEYLSRASEVSNNHTRYLDHQFDFTVTNYGFTYKGRTGTVIDNSVLKHGAWEKHVLLFLEDYIRAAGLKDTAFIDVGANTGTHTLFMATRVKEVHAFDPYPPVLERLNENVTLNKFTNIKVHPVGLGDQEASIPFYAADEDNHGNGTFRAEAGNKPFGHLRIVVGDEYLKTVKLPPVSIVKVDIEGYEEAALKGLRQTLAQHRPLVFLEVSTLPRGTIASFEQLRGLFPANYVFFAVADDYESYLDGRYDLTEFTPTAAAGFFGKQHAHSNFVAVPAEKAAHVPRHRPGTW